MPPSVPPRVYGGVREAERLCRQQEGAVQPALDADSATTRLASATATACPVSCSELADSRATTSAASERSDYADEQPVP